MKKTLLTLASALFVLSQTAWAGVPTAFTHQGLLREDGNLVNGTRTLTATIFNENGDIVATTTKDVEVDSGYYNFTIQNIETAKAATAKKLTLKINVAGQDLEPALEINSVPYALVAKQAESLNTSGTQSMAIFSYTKDGDPITNGSFDEENRCPCDKDVNNWDCEESFTNDLFNKETCFDQYGPAYQLYNRDEVTHPAEVVAIDKNTIGVGTAKADSPLHILSDIGNDENGFDIHIADIYPRILLDDLDGDKFIISANDSEFSVSADNEGSLSPLFILDQNGMKVNGTLSADKISGDIKISADNATFNYAASNSKGGPASSIEDGIVTTAKIADGNVTKAKFDSSVQTSLGLADNSIQKATGSVTSDFIKDGTIVNGDIANTTIDKVKLTTAVQTSLGLADNSIQKATGSVTSDFIKDGTIVNGDIANTTIDKVKLTTAVQTSLGLADNSIQKATGSVTSAYILDGTIATTDLANSAVTTAKIATSAVDRTKLADEVITAKAWFLIGTKTGPDCSATVDTTGTCTYYCTGAQMRPYIIKYKAKGTCTISQSSSSGYTINCPSESFNRYLPVMVEDTNYYYLMKYWAYATSTTNIMVNAKRITSLGGSENTQNSVLSYATTHAAAYGSDTVSVKVNGSCNLDTNPGYFTTDDSIRFYSSASTLIVVW